jgi:hypothetical protein
MSMDYTKIKPTHIKHLYTIALAVANDTPNKIQVKGLAQYVTRAIQHSLRKASRVRADLRKMLRAAGRAHQMDLARDREAASERARASSASSRSRDAAYRGQHQ